MADKEDLLNLARERFPDIDGHPYEVALCIAAQKSGWAYFKKQPDKPGKEGEPGPATWKCLNERGQGDIKLLPKKPSEAELPVIRAKVVAWLLTDRKAHEHMTHNGLTICGARIVGWLDASFAVFPWQFRLSRCFVPDGMLLQDAEFGLLNFKGSHVHGGQTAIDADRIKVKGSVFLNDGFSAVGMVRFLDADVGGTFECSNGSFRAKPEGQELTSTDCALIADRIKVKGSVFLDDGFTAVGMVRFLGADVGGNFECTKGSFRAKPEGQELTSEDSTLSADGIKVKGSVFLNDGFSAVGEVRFLGADVGGTFECANGSFRTKLEGQELIRTDFALLADGIKVKGSVFLNDGFSAVGMVRFPGADVGGDFVCTKGSFRAKTEGQELTSTDFALSADGIKVKGNVFLSDGFSAVGMVWFLGADVGGDFYLIDRPEEPPRIDGKLVLHTATIHGKLSLIKAQWGDKGEIDLSHASASVLKDDMGSWPGEGKVILSGFTFDRFHRESPTSSKDRLAWLALQLEEPFSPQPYEQLAKVYRESGHEVEAKAVLFEKSDRAHRRMAEQVKPHLKHPAPLLLCILELFVRSIFAFCVFLSCRFTAMFHAVGWQAKLSALCSGGAGEEGNHNGYPWGRVTEWVWGDVLRFTVGYGYKPRLVWRCFALFLGTGALLFWLLSPAMTTAAQSVYTNIMPAMEHGTNSELPGTEYWKQRHAEASMKGAFLADDYPHFNSFLYALDTFIPLVDLNLNQKKYWYPDSNKPIRAFILYTYLIIHTTAGWVLVSLLAASLAGVIKK